MTAEDSLQKTIREAIQTEKDAMDFYKYGALKMSEQRPREVFELLAREERQHAKMFFQVYRGGDIPSFDEFIESPPSTESRWFKALQQAMLSDFDERKALELAIEQEEDLEKNLRAAAEQVTDPELKAIYVANANSTHHHAKLIEDEYRAMLGMSG